MHNLPFHVYWLQVAPSCRSPGLPSPAPSPPRLVVNLPPVALSCPPRLVANLLFRMGASATLLSNNRASWGERAKYRLQHIERVHVGQNDEAYK